MSFDEQYYKTLIHQYLTILTSDDPFSPYTVAHNTIDPNSSTPNSTISIPPLPTFLHQQVQQIEHPNLLNPQGATSDHDTILSRARAASSIITASKFEVQSILIADASSGDTAERKAAVEALWTGTVARNVNERLTEGLLLKARFAIFFVFRDGKIWRQTNYDCFDPF